MTKFPSNFSGTKIASPNPPARWFVILVTSCLLAGMALSPALWQTREALPNLPVFTWLPCFAKPWDVVLWLASAGCLAGAAMVPKLRLLAVPGLLGLLLMGLQDQLRWQPWAWQYFLALITFYSLNRSDGTTDAAHWTLQRLLLAAVYFWSGFFKLGSGFQALHLEVFVQPLKLEEALPWLHSSLLLLGQAAPWLEMGLAIGLFFNRTRRASVVLLGVMHAWILYGLGFVAALPNTIVWPWNVGMVLLLATLFWNGGEISLRPLFGRRAIPLTLGAALFLIIGPLLSLGEHWDRYLSFQLYSGRDRRGILVMDLITHAALPPRIQAACIPVPHDPNIRELRFMEWGTRELNVPPPCEHRILLAMARHVAAYPKRGGTFFQFYTDHPFRRKEFGWDMFPVGQLRSMKRIPEKLRHKF